MLEDINFQNKTIAGFFPLNLLLTEWVQIQNIDYHGFIILSGCNTNNYKNVILNF